MGKKTEFEADMVNLLDFLHVLHAECGQFIKKTYISAGEDSVRLVFENSRELVIYSDGTLALHLPETSQWYAVELRHTMAIS